MGFLKFLDLFQVKLHFYINNRPNYQSIFGGIMSISFFLLCIICFVILSYDDFKKMNPISSKSEIPDVGLRTVNILKEKIWIPFRMVTYEEQFVDHRGILFPQLYYVEGKWDNELGMNLSYHLLTYKLCNETSMAKKPERYKINVPLNEIFCVEADNISFGGSWNGDYINYLEYNLHLCQEGINFNSSDPRCTKLENLLKHRSTSWIFEFYYPVVQFQPTNYDVPLGVIYRSYFYRLATYTNKVERIYISEHILNDDTGILYSNSKNSSCWGMSSLYGDDYHMEYEVDPLVKSTSSRLYSLDIYMDQGTVYYNRSYKKLFLIFSDFFPILKVLYFFFKRITQHFKKSTIKRNLASLIFENVSKKQKFEMNTSLNNLHQKGNKLIIETNNNSKKEFKNKNNFIDGNNSFIDINKNNIKKKNLVNIKNSQSDIIKNSISNNKSNLSLNNENIMQILNQQEITKLRNLNSNRKSLTLIKESKKNETLNTNRNINSKKIKKNENKVFPYLYFFLDIIFDKIEHPQKFYCIPHKYFIVYKFMGQMYDISTNVMLIKQFNNLNNFIFESINKSNYLYPFEINTKININDQTLVNQLNKNFKIYKV